MGSTRSTAAGGALSGLLLRIGMLAAALAFTSWWVSHTILDVSRTRRVAETVLGDSTFRHFVAGEIQPMVSSVVPLESLQGALSTSGLEGLVPTTTVPATPATPAVTAAASGDELQSRLATVLGRKDVEHQLVDFVTDIHRGLLGQRDAPAVLSQATITEIVSTAVPAMAPADLAKLHPVSITAPRIGVLSAGHRLLADKFVPLIVIAALLLAGALVISGDRRSTVRTIGRWLIGISLMHLLVLWVIPVVVVPHLTSSPWASLVSSVARALGAGLITGLVLLFVLGVVFVVGDRFLGNPNDLGAPPAS